MKGQNNANILGIGFYVPEEVRENTWWSEETINRWINDKRRFSSAFDLDAIEIEDLSQEARLLIEMLHELRQRTDIFEGSERRYILAKDQKTSDMEIEAAKQALKNADLSSNKIDFILSQSTLPDILCDGNACIVHRALNLRSDCFSQEVLGMCNAFMHQLFVAQSLIRSGMARYGLLIQSSGTSRLVEAEHPSSPFFGDGATAVVVGPDNQYGVQSIKNDTHGGLGSYFTTGVPGKRWYDEGRIKTYIGNVASGPLLNFHAVEQSKILVEAALSESKLNKSEIQFYAGHQGMSWFRQLTQKVIGIEHAKTYDTFRMYASLLGANLPLVFYHAIQQNLLVKDDNVVAFSPGTGMTAAGLVIRWGL